MTENMKAWNALGTTNPKFVKPITGRQYNGSSPNPTYILMKLTEQFGPATQGWGMEIMSQWERDYGSGTDAQTLHYAQVRLWTRDPQTGERNSVEQIGCTKIAYVTKSGKFMLDDDGAKKSVTDALIKCASYLGCAADIFLGRWDDAKYQSDLRAQFGQDPETPIEPGKAPAPRNATPAPAAADDAPW